MDQKNTIVKCKAHPNCLFNHSGACDNYVINIGADGKCECYVETARVDNFGISEIAIYKAGSKEPLLILEEPQRNQRAKRDFYDNTCDNKETAIAAIQDELLRQQMCWYCDNGSHGSCKLTAKPSLDRSGKCPRYTSTGGNR